MKIFNWTIGKQKLSLILITILSFFLIVDLNQHYEPEGLDPSWRQSYNYFMENVFKFGKEVIFTYGPAATLFLDSFSENLYWAKITIDILLSLISTVFVWLIGRKVGWVPAILLTIAHIYNYGEDTFYFALQILCLFLVVFYADEIAIKNEKSKYGLYSLIAGSVLLIGLLSCSKFTFFVTGIFIVLLMACYLFIIKQRLLAITAFTAWIFSLIFYWLLFDQSLQYLFAYLSNSIEISLGYAAAMSISGPKITIIAALILTIICGVLAVSPIKRYLKMNKPKLILIVSIVGVGFIVWKEAFVRHDLHLIFFYYYLMYISVFIFCIHNDKSEPTTINEYWLNPILQKVILCLIFVLPLLVVGKGYYGYYFDHRIVTDKIQKINSNIKYFANPTLMWKQKSKLVEQRRGVRSENQYLILKDYVKQDTIDIYNYNQNILLHNNLNWLPRPIFQSYSAYTSKLLKTNESHIIQNGPKFVLFNNETIDGRLPLLDDNLWIRQLFHRYKYITTINNQLLLERKENVEVPELIEVQSEILKINEKISIPNTGKPIYISAKIEESLIGKIRSLVFKPPAVNMVVTMKDGSSRKYRVIPDMISQPTLVSPLLDNNNKVLNFLYGLSSNFVESVKFVTTNSIYYKSDIKIKVYEDNWPNNGITSSEIFSLMPTNYISNIPPEIIFVYNKNTFYFHPDAELHFSIEGQRLAKATIGLMPEVKGDQKSDGINLYWEAERGGSWEQFGKIEYTPEMFVDDFVSLEAEIPEGVSKIRLRIDGGNNHDLSYDWAVIGGILIE
jgi:hypothetical protein